MNLFIILKLDFVVCDIMPVSVNKVVKNRKRIVSAVYRVHELGSMRPNPYALLEKLPLLPCKFYYFS